VIYFDYNSSEIKPEGAELIDAHARFLTANKTRQVSLEGHTDERGGREFNLALGQKRAEAVRTRMRLLGVTDIQMEAVSFGKEKPAAVGNDDAAHAKNRRTEINYAR
jgi:peptidoglycan-associated lipoprotein